MDNQLDLFEHGKYNYRHRVYNKISYDLKTGKIVKEPGYISGKFENLQAHHFDIFNQPEEYIWLSSRYHLLLHVLIKKYEYEFNQVEIITKMRECYEAYATVTADFILNKS